MKTKHRIKLLNITGDGIMHKFGLTLVRQLLRRNKYTNLNVEVSNLYRTK